MGTSERGMKMDSFFEQIVKKKKSAKEWAVIVSVLLAAVVLVAFVWLFNILPVITTVGIIYGAWWLITGQNVEFEYCVTNGDIDVDKIIARRKRTRLVSVAGRKIRALAPYDPAKPLGKFQRTVVVAPSLNEEGLWYFTYHSKKNGDTLVIFMPDDRVLGAFYDGLPKLIQMDTARAAREAGLPVPAKPYTED